MRTSPACGAQNSNLSLFCAECGTALNGVSWQGGNDATQTYQPVSVAASGNTGEYEPATSASRSHERYPASHPADADADATWSGSIGTSYANEHGDDGAAPLVSAWSDDEGRVDRGVRGFVLGSLAWVIILAVFVLLLWVGVFSTGFKNDVRDIIPGLAMISLF
jgi:hypothetical protein